MTASIFEDPYCTSRTPDDTISDPSVSVGRFPRKASLGKEISELDSEQKGDVLSSSPPHEEVSLDEGNACALTGSERLEPPVFSGALCEVRGAYTAASAAVDVSSELATNGAQPSSPSVEAVRILNSNDEVIHAIVNLICDAAVKGQMTYSSSEPDGRKNLIHVLAQERSSSKVRSRSRGQSPKVRRARTRSADHVEKLRRKEDCKKKKKKSLFVESGCRYHSSPRYSLVLTNTVALVLAEEARTRSFQSRPADQEVVRGSKQSVAV
jgi:hypothetical protein